MAYLFAVQGGGSQTVSPSDTVVQKKSLAPNETITEGIFVQSEIPVASQTLIPIEMLDENATVDPAPKFYLATHVRVPVYRNGLIKKDKQSLRVCEFNTQRVSKQSDLDQPDNRKGGGTLTGGCTGLAHPASNKRNDVDEARIVICLT